MPFPTDVDITATMAKMNADFPDMDRTADGRPVTKPTVSFVGVVEMQGRLPSARYAALAGHPGAARAAGSALGSNPVAVLIPCHRVIRASGAVTGYRWGTGRKLALLGRELARAEEREAGAPA